MHKNICKKLCDIKIKIWYNILRLCAFNLSLSYLKANSNELKQEKNI